MFTNMRIINAFTTLDEIMQIEDGVEYFLDQGYEMEDMFFLGQFYQWAQVIVKDESIEMDDMTELPDPIWGEYIPQIEKMQDKMDNNR